MKFGRIFNISVQGQQKTHQIQSPLTVRFQIDNNSLYSHGTGVFHLYNLAAQTRADLYKDIYETAIYRQMVFSAGYQIDSSRQGGGISLPIVYQGNVIQAFSYREGPDWITEIHCLDGGFMQDNASINLTKPSPYSFRDLVTTVIDTLNPFNLTLGVVGSFDLPNSRGISFQGHPWDLLTQLVTPQQGQVFINKEKVYILQQWEVILDEGLITTLDSNTGIIGTPLLQNALVTARMIFEPRLEIAQMVQLNTLQTRMKGQYKVLRLVHSGTISGAVCEALITEATLFQPDRAFEEAA